jgi:hypothetical protein
MMFVGGLMCICCHPGAVQLHWLLCEVLISCSSDRLRQRLLEPGEQGKQHLDSMLCVTVLSMK